MEIGMAAVTTKVREDYLLKMEENCDMSSWGLVGHHWYSDNLSGATKEKAGNKTDTLLQASHYTPLLTTRTPLAYLKQLWNADPRATYSPVGRPLAWKLYRVRYNGR
jgi:hypothetical protein